MGGCCVARAAGTPAARACFLPTGTCCLPELTDGTGGQYGRVSYLHAGGIDRPLLITKGGTSVIPHDNWRGTFATGTLATGQRAECHGTTVTNCLWIVWPGWKTTASHAAETTPSGQSDWWGGLVDGMRDASGRMYMRNRYYDPKTGQFTQTDPIGLAGGLNSYGFASGDPVSYADPYGLKADTLIPVNQAAKEALGELVLTAAVAVNYGDERQAEAGQAILTMINDLIASDTRVFFSVDATRGRSATGSMNDGSGIGSLVNPNQSAKRYITVRAAHELGHAWGIVVLGADDPNSSADRTTQNRVSVRFENHVRAMYKCAYRPVHGTDTNTDNPPCQP
jgi:RHS repeat-associated protein